MGLDSRHNHLRTVNNQLDNPDRIRKLCQHRRTSIQPRHNLLPTKTERQSILRKNTRTAMETTTNSTIGLPLIQLGSLLVKLRRNVKVTSLLARLTEFPIL